MKKFILSILEAIFIIACTTDQVQTNKDMQQISFSTEQAAAMTAIACNEAKGDIKALENAIKEGLNAGLTVNQIKEALSQLYAYTGFPRSLNALGILQQIVKEGKYEEGADASPLPSHYDALKQGTAIQTMLTGKPFNYSFAKSTDYYLKAHLFGDIFARDVLTYADRELVTVSALAGLEGVTPQLGAHIAGARNMGVTEEQLQSIVVALTAHHLFVEAGRIATLLQTKWPQGQPNTTYAPFFVGKSYLHPYYDGVANVTFEPGCRNNWHVHHGAIQVLVCVSGKGWYQEWGKPAIPLTPGTVIPIPEGVKHWHGAVKDSWMQHLAIHTEAQEKTSNEWLEIVNDKQYNTLKN